MSKRTEKWNRGWSRRKFLTRVAQAGGAGALYESMIAMGLVNLPGAWNGMPQLKPNQGEGQSVVVLGAGIGGLTTAYILSKYGYRVQILEASHRAGGRNFSARRGDTVLEEGPHGPTRQRCEFDSDLYLNMGPGRLPYHHRRVLGYCQELGVELQPYIMNTTGNLFQTEKAFEGNPQVYRHVQNDTRGYLSEMLAKVVEKGKLDEELDDTDKERLLGLLDVFGSLDEEHKYVGTTRDGCGEVNGEPTPNVTTGCSDPEKMDWSTLLESEFWDNSFYDPIEFEWQATLFQPVGGMDQIVNGFTRQVGNLITYNAPVTKIEVSDSAVEVTYQQGAKEVTAKADYCVSNIPCPILSTLKHNFSKDFTEAIKETTFSPSCKVGWQANNRFWENNENQIYGGISWTDDIIEQIWYPSNDFFGQKGTLTGAYIHGDNADKFGKMSLDERLKAAKEGATRLHPEFANDALVPTELGLSIAWQYVPHQLGAWPSWDPTNQDHNQAYRRILKPERGRFFITGDQASTLPGWQEGAMMSAEHVVELIGGTKKIENLDLDNVFAPDTELIMRGRG